MLYHKFLFQPTGVDQKLVDNYRLATYTICVEQVCSVAKLALQPTTYCSILADTRG